MDRRALGVLMGLAAFSGPLAGCSSGSSSTSDADGGADGSASATFTSETASGASTIHLGSSGGGSTSGVVSASSEASSSGPGGSSRSSSSGLESSSSSSAPASSGSSGASSSSSSPSSGSSQSSARSSGSGSSRSVSGSESASSSSSTATGSSTTSSSVATGSTITSSSSTTSRTSAGSTSTSSGSSTSSSATSSTTASTTSSPGGSSSSSSASTSSSSSSAAGTSTSFTTTSGTTASSSTTSTGSTTASSSTTSSSGTLLLLGGASGSLLAGAFTIAGGWTTTTLFPGTAFAPALSIDSSGTGYGLYTQSTNSLVSYVTWSDGSWLSPGAIGTGTSIGRPAVDATGSDAVDAIFQGTDHKFYSLFFAHNAWTDPAAVGSPQCTGNVPPSVAALGSDVAVGFIDGNGYTNDAAEVDDTGGTWGAADDLTGAVDYDIPARIIPLSSGPELMLVFVEGAGSQVDFMTRTSGVWSAVQRISSCLTNDEVALAPLPGGHAILAIKGTDGNLYWTEYTSGVGWGTVSPLSTPNVATSASPAVTHGIGTDDAELAYLDGSGVAYATRLSGSTWSAPALVGGTGLTGIAVASTP